MTKSAPKDYIIHTIFKTNILPMQSECNTSCAFCSHKQNPPGIEVYKMPTLSCLEYEEFLAYLSGDKKIIIGESATRIMEGEPLIHPEFIDILKKVRMKFPKTPIQITTNGILLEESLVHQLQALGGIELNISINCIDPKKRVILLGTHQCGNIREIVGRVKGRLKFYGSLVFMPERTAFEDIHEIAQMLDECGADALRVFLEGYTHYSTKDVKMDFRQAFETVTAYVKTIRSQYALPITIEPTWMEDTTCVVEGTKKNSPAHLAGLAVGDEILAVNGDAVETRVDGFNKAYQARNPVLSIRRGTALIEIQLLKSQKVSPGFVVMQDLDPKLLQELTAVATKYHAQHILFVTSLLGQGVFSSLLKKSAFPTRYDIVTSKNAFFGGNIQCAGLLTGSDVIAAVLEYLKNKQAPDLIILPHIMFDFTKKDLTGMSLKEIGATLGIQVDIA